MSSSLKHCYPGAQGPACEEKATQFVLVHIPDGSVWYKRYCEVHRRTIESIQAEYPDGELDPVDEAYFDAMEVHEE